MPVKQKFIFLEKKNMIFFRFWLIFATRIRFLTRIRMAEIKQIRIRDTVKIKTKK